MTIFRRYPPRLLRFPCVMGMLALSSCAAPASESLGLPPAELGERAFEAALSGGNGRSCGDCHVKGRGRGLPADHVRALRKSSPDHPLFAGIDADDPGAAVKTFNNLSHGLVRVRLPLPDNMDLIDFAGDVTTPSDRMVEVWRAVPSIENTAYTGPYLHDGRAATLEEQALGALKSHSAFTLPADTLPVHWMATFERSSFSSDRARRVHEQIEAGVHPLDVPIPEDDPAFLATLTPAQRSGKEVYDRACTGCHGGATGNVIVDRRVHDSLCTEPGPDGNLVFEFADMNGNGVVDTAAEEASSTFQAPPEGCGEFMLLATVAGTVSGQLGRHPAPIPFNATADLPRYRFRFYRDAERTVHWTDLPPIPVVDEEGNAAVDERGLLIVGPSGTPQPFSTDPGRALISGHPSDFEAFDVPQLRGIANTAPYFHDNLMATLEDVVDVYSRAILPFTTALELPPIHPTEQPSFFPGEALSAGEKADLVDFLKIL